jgi:acyl-coenzyme A thioesterase PaaI-like protein
MTELESSRLFDLENASAFVAGASLRVTHIAADRVEGTIDLGPEHHQPWGLVHGGVYTTAVETAASVGASVAASRQQQHALPSLDVRGPGRGRRHADPAGAYPAALGGADQRR